MIKTKSNKHFEVEPEEDVANILRDMFRPILEKFEVVETWTQPTYNGCGENIIYMWEGPGHHYTTTYNTWSVRHPDTILQKVDRIRMVEWAIRPNGEPIKYKDMK